MLQVVAMCATCQERRENKVAAANKRKNRLSKWGRDEYNSGHFVSLVQKDTWNTSQWQVMSELVDWVSRQWSVCVCSGLRLLVFGQSVGSKRRGRKEREREKEVRWVCPMQVSVSCCSYYRRERELSDWHEKSAGLNQSWKQVRPQVTSSLEKLTKWMYFLTQPSE